MSRVSCLVLGVVALICLVVAPVQATYIPLVYNNSTSSDILDWNMETDNPVVGSVSYSTGGSSTFGVVSAASEGIAAYEGNNVLKSFRATGWGSMAYLNCGTPSGAGETTTTSFAIQCPTSSSYVSLWMGTSGIAENMGSIYLLGTGAINYYQSGWKDTGLTHTIGAWNQFVLTHTNGSADWGLSVNGSAAVTLTMAGAGSETGNYGGFSLTNSNDPVAFYFDAQGSAPPAGSPEPSAVMLMVTGLVSFLAYAWRKRK
jgi:hypothetical protein